MDGNGQNPSVYLVNVGDIVTIRGLTDVNATGNVQYQVITSTGLIVTDSMGNPVVVNVPSIEGPYSALNGTYIVIDSGYNYFTIRNPNYQQTTGQVFQPSPSTIFFTSPIPHRLSEQTNYAWISQTDPETVDVFVPAIPPIVTRTLIGSAHLHGSEVPVESFTRNSITVDLSMIDTIPNGANQFLFYSNFMAIDFRKLPYKTISANGNVYAVQTTDSTDYSFLPYTVPTSIGSTNRFYVPFQQNLATVTFGFPHGLQIGWGVTFTGATGSGNITGAMLNSEFVVVNVLNNMQIQIQLPVTNQGSIVSGFNVYRVSSPRSDGADFYLQFPSNAALVAAGFEDDTLTKLTAMGFNNVGYIATLLRSRDLYVIDQDSANVYVRSGLGVGPEGLIITDGTAHHH